jgi:hypothetical protein
MGDDLPTPGSLVLVRPVWQVGLLSFSRVAVFVIPLD